MSSPQRNRKASKSTIRVGVKGLNDAILVVTLFAQFRWNLGKQLYVLVPAPQTTQPPDWDIKLCLNVLQYRRILWLKSTRATIQVSNWSCFDALMQSSEYSYWNIYSSKINADFV